MATLAGIGWGNFLKWKYAQGPSRLPSWPSASFVLASRLVPQPQQPNQAAAYVTQIAHDPQRDPERRWCSLRQDSSRVLPNQQDHVPATSLAAEQPQSFTQ